MHLAGGVSPPYVLELLGFVIELAVLLFIWREVRALRSHERALHQHEQQLMAVRPLLSSLYTADEDIMDLAVRFTEEATAIDAIGSIASLADTERNPIESDEQFNKRINSVDSKKITYVTRTAERIAGGCRYRRIMNFVPTTDREAVEVIANVTFFLRAFEGPRAKPLRLELFHNSDILKGRGDFHFRCSDKQVVLRVGGHGNRHANAAIAINDTRVIEQFRGYYESLISATETRPVPYAELKRLHALLVNKKYIDVAALLTSRSSGDSR